LTKRTNAVVAHVFHSVCVCALHMVIPHNDSLSRSQSACSYRRMIGGVAFGMHKVPCGCMRYQRSILPRTPEHDLTCLSHAHCLASAALDAFTLRTRYRICGHLIGMVPGYRQTTTASSLPLLLLPEETTLGLDRGKYCISASRCGLAACCSDAYATINL
jgi:hypothetical protein